MSRDASSMVSPFGALIRRARREAGFTQEQLAERSGLSVRAISDIERGIYRRPHLATLDLLADALDLSIEERAEWTRVREASKAPRRPAGGLDRSDALTSGARLPPTLTSFVGRSGELQTLAQLLRGPAARLVTLTGTGGVGKTRLALAAARSLQGDFRDGARFVDLAPVADARRVLPAIAAALNLQANANRPIEAVLTSHLRSRELLLVLDNLEQVVDVAPDVARIVAMCPSLVVLATSRVPLHVRGEHELPLPPLSVPEEREDRLSLDEVLGSDALMLLLQRTRAVRPDFSITAETAPIAVELCRRLGGVPLMIELAAARIRSLPIEEILDRLDQSLALLKSQTRDLPARQQTLRGTIEWSYRLLAAEEQLLFRRVGVLRGGFSLAAAATVAEQANELDTLDLLERLIEHGLVQVVSGRDRATRYTMLEMLREYALEQLCGDDEEMTTRDLHAGYFLALAEEAQGHLQIADQAEWIAVLEEAHNNLRGALEWSASRAHAGDERAVSTCLRFGAALWWFWFTRGHLREARDHLGMAITLGRTLLESPSVGSEPRKIADEFAGSLIAYATISFWLTDYQLSMELLDECIVLNRELHHEQRIAEAIVFKAYALSRTGEQDAAERLLVEGISLHRRRNDRVGIALGLLLYGEIALRSGDFAEGERKIRECLRLYQELGDLRAIIATKASLGALRLCQGDRATAGTLLRGSLAGRYRIGDMGGMAWSLEWLARLTLAESESQTDATRAMKLLAASRQLREETGSEADPADRPSNDAVLSTARRRLTDTAFVVAWEAGRAMSLKDVVAFGLEDGDGPVDSVRSAATPTVSLSPRESEVLTLLADGLSDREIAGQLHVSPRTVSSHVTHILNKLGVMSRTAAATKAVRAGLI